jgi:hypothetical protein
MNPDQLPPPAMPTNTPLPSFGPAKSADPVHQTSVNGNRSGAFPPSVGRQLCYMAAYLLLAGILMLANNMTPGLYELGTLAVAVFWGAAAIHSVALFVALLASLFKKRWQDAGTYGFCLLAVPLLSCGYCLVGMNWVD